MTKIKVFHKEGHIMELEVKGHTGFGEEGTDIVCAAISALTQSALMGLKEVAKLNVESSIGEGYLSFKISETNEKSDAILDTLYIALRDLANGYKRHIKMEDCKYVY
ncbi:MAG: ribosomal-processing cysteine protease Prp [Clostridia bacterium]|nr:ribosomal-processing cysteine protease Prp [Clostridia bacterium]